LPLKVVTLSLLVVVVQGAVAVEVQYKKMPFKNFVNNLLLKINFLEFLKLKRELSKLLESKEASIQKQKSTQSPQKSKPTIRNLRF